MYPTQSLDCMRLRYCYQWHCFQLVQFVQLAQLAQKLVALQLIERLYMINKHDANTLPTDPSYQHPHSLITNGGDRQERR